MGGGGAGDEGQVDVHPRLLQTPGRRHGDVVDAGNVLEGAEGGDLQPQAHELIDVLLPEALQKLGVLPAAVTGGILLGGEKLEVHEGIEGDHLPLVVQQYLEHRQIKLGAVHMLLGVGGEIPLGVETGSDIPVAEGQPPVLGHGGELGQDGGAYLEDLVALQPSPQGEQLVQFLGPAGGLQQGQGGAAVGGVGQLPLHQGVGHLSGELTDQFFVHRRPAFLGVT